MTMYCPNCGHECPDGTKFCPSCGSAMEASGSQQNSQYAYQQQNNSNGYPQPGYNRGSKAPIRNRSVAMCIILSIITCGLYGIYWFICLVNDLNATSDHPSDTSGGMVFLLGLVTCGIYDLFWAYKAGEKVEHMKEKYNGVHDSNSGIIYLLLSLFGLGMVAWALIQSELNKVASY